MTRRAAATLLAALLGAHLATAGQRPRYGGELHRVTFAPLGTVDPVAASSFEEIELVRNVHATLLERRPDGSYGPGLAERFAVEGTRLQLTLRPGLAFHDGAPLTAAAVRASLARLLVSAPWLLRLPGIPAATGIRAVGDRRLELDLVGPDARLLLELLADPIASVTATGSDGALVGAGPWRIALRAPSLVRLEPNLAHHAGRPYLDALVIESVTAPADQRRALQSSAWDVIDLPAAADAGAGATVVVAEGEETVSVRLDARRGPWSAAKVLAALRAVDRPSMVDVILKGRGAAALNLVSPALFPLAARSSAAAEAAGPASARTAAPLLFPSHDTDLALAAERVRFELRPVATVEPRPLALDEWRKAGVGSGALLGAVYLPVRGLSIALGRVLLGERADGKDVAAAGGDPAAAVAALLALPPSGSTRVDLFHRTRRLLVREGVVGLGARVDGPPSYADVWRALE